MIEIKRVYVPPEKTHGVRFLVERLWPRGVRKVQLKLESWPKELAPSTQLRKWFSHDVAKWKEFQRRYRAELDQHPEAWQPLLQAARKGNVTLLFSSHDAMHNNALVLKAYLEAKQSRDPWLMEKTTSRLESLEDSDGESSAETLENLIYRQLELLGEDPTRDGLRETPARVAKSLAFLTRGYQDDPRRTVNGAIFETQSGEMVIVKGVEFYSLCEHHLLPFFGHCHIGYLPSGKIIGLSKLARLVEVFSRRLQVQERMTLEIARALSGLIPNHGVGVVVEAQHLCMKMRGIQKQDSRTMTSALLGKFRDDSKTRLEFLTLIQPAVRISVGPFECNSRCCLCGQNFEKGKSKTRCEYENCKSSRAHSNRDRTAKSHRGNGRCIARPDD